MPNTSAVEGAALSVLSNGHATFVGEYFGYDLKATAPGAPRAPPEWRSTRLCP